MIIKRTDNTEIGEFEGSTLKEALESAVKSGADLRGADLRGADLRGADLRGAYLGRADLRGANLRGANLRGAYLRGANLGEANLREANLRGASLRGAYLREAYLREAYLREADLGGANLRGANLRGAKDFHPEQFNSLLVLLDQPGKIRAYKLVDENYQSPIQTTNKLTYIVGTTIKKPADTDPLKECAKGINVATLDWCLSWYQPTYRVLIVEFEAKDIACIPHTSDGKFRVHQCKVIGEKDVSHIVGNSRDPEST